MAHAAGAEIVVDAAQLVAHRPLAMEERGSGPPRLRGVLRAQDVRAVRRGRPRREPRRVRDGRPGHRRRRRGGHREPRERVLDRPAGSGGGRTPDIVGVVALARAIRALEEIGWEKILRHEAELTAAALERLSAIPGLDLYGDTRPAAAASRLGVIPFNVRGVPHALTAAVLACEWGIGTRNGCFCAHPYVKELLHVSEAEGRKVEESILARDRSTIPGAVRASFGLFNTISDVEALAEALEAICRHDFDSGYVLDHERGEYNHRSFRQTSGAVSPSEPAVGEAVVNLHQARAVRFPNTVGGPRGRGCREREERVPMPTKDLTIAMVGSGGDGVVTAGRPHRAGRRPRGPSRDQDRGLRAADPRGRSLLHGPAWPPKEIFAQGDTRGCAGRLRLGRLRAFPRRDLRRARTPSS